MRRMIPLLALSAALPVMAQEAPTPKFAVVIPDYILGNSVRGKKVTAGLEVLGKALQDRLRGKADELQKLEQQLKSPGLSEEGRAKVSRDLQDGEVAFKRAQEDAQKEFNVARDKVSKTYQEEVRPLVDALAKEWKLQVLFNYQEGLFQYADEAWLTSFSKEIIVRYDAKFPAEPGDKPSTAAPVAAKPSKAPAKK